MANVWITGASSGIGEALAKSYAKKSASLVLSARNIDELNRVAELCRNQGAKKVVVEPLDLAAPSGYDEITQRVLSAMGQIDVLVNNGGISQRSLVLETSTLVDQRIMQVNYLGTVALTKSLLPHFVERGGGHLVVISSVVGKFGTPYRSAYAASKHALHGFFDSLRAELCSKGIAVTIICPGFVRTSVTINALTGDGTALGTDDVATYQGMPVELFAAKAMRAIERKKQEVYIGGREALGVYLKRFFPRLFAKMIITAKVR